MVESFIATLKIKLMIGPVSRRQEAHKEIFAYLEGFYKQASSQPAVFAKPVEDHTLPWRSSAGLL